MSVTKFPPPESGEVSGKGSLVSGLVEETKSCEPGTRMEELAVLAAVVIVVGVMVGVVGSCAPGREKEKWRFEDCRDDKTL